VSENTKPNIKMNTITYGNKEYIINTEALAAQGDEWKAIIFKGYADRNFKCFHGDREEIESICNAGSSRLEEYTAEEIAKHPDDMPSGLEGPGFWTVTCDSDEGEQFEDFWSAAEHILTDDKQNGGTWTADEMVAALKARTPQTCFAMIEALMSIDILEEVKEEAE
jgi:hypothetical protein